MLDEIMAWASKICAVSFSFFSCESLTNGIGTETWDDSPCDNEHAWTSMTSDPLKIRQKPIDLEAKIAEQEWNNDDVEHQNFGVYSCLSHGM